MCYTCIETDFNKDDGHKTLYLIIPEVTELEHDVIMNGIAESDTFNETTNGMIWSDVVIENCEKTTPTQLTSVIISLVEKGLLLYRGSRADATLQLTAEGYTYYLRNRGE